VKKFCASPAGDDGIKDGDETDVGLLRHGRTAV
jgi:hypothetical protein